MRLALTHAYSWPETRRGAERFVVELAGALAARGHDVVVFTAGGSASRHRGGGQGKGRGEGHLTTVKLRQIRAAGVAHEADFGRRLLPYLVANRFDAVHSLGRRDAVASLRAARLRGLLTPAARTRTVFTDLGIPYREFWDAQVGETRWHERVVRDIDVYGCMSRFALDVLAQDYGRDGVLTPGGVNLDEFSPAPRADHPVVLFSGAIYEPRKGVAQLLDALALVIKQEPRAELWLSGPGDATELLARAPDAVRARTRVLGLGEVHAQGERYAAAWATALPSKHDSFGMALLESLACGTPVVASNHSAVPELASPMTGAVCDPDDPASIASACLAAFALARDVATVEACRAAARPYDWRTSLAPAFERLYAGQ